MRYFAFVALFAFVGLAFAQDSDDVVAADSIVDALIGDKQTRAVIAKRKRGPAGMSIGLKIEFEFDSDMLSPEATAQLDQLLGALNTPDLATYAFRLVGHTDGKGAADYNLVLSERRAASVARYLTERNVDPDRIVSEGKGESDLLYPHKPEDPGNRRVEIINLGKRADSN